MPNVFSTIRKVSQGDYGLITLDAIGNRHNNTHSNTGNKSAFAIVKDDGSVVSWGHHLSGADNQAVANKLEQDVISLASTWHAFAALKKDGSVVTWGYAPSGGDSTNVESELGEGVISIASNAHAFAALKTDGTVVTWGGAIGGEKGEATSQLQGGVRSLYSNNTGFAAIKNDGTVVSWGLDTFSGYIKPPEFFRANTIAATDSAFAALTTTGDVITWGVDDFGGDSSSVEERLDTERIEKIFSTYDSFAAVTTDGGVITWGNQSSAGNSEEVTELISDGVASIAGTGDAFNPSAFAALKTDGSVVTWGDPDSGGNSDQVSEKLKSNVDRIYSNASSFAALKADGSVVTWGNPNKGGDSSSVKNQLQENVKTITANDYAFAALKTDGSVTTWGDTWGGGNSSPVKQQISSNVIDIVSNRSAFSAIKADGSVITWGSQSEGGDSAITGPNGSKTSKAEALSSGATLGSNPQKIQKLIQTTPEGENYTFTIKNTTETTKTFYWNIRNHNNEIRRSDFSGLPRSLTKYDYETHINWYDSSYWPSITLRSGEAQDVSFQIAEDKLVEDLEAFDIVVSDNRYNQINTWIYNSTGIIQDQSTEYITFKDEDSFTNTRDIPFHGNAPNGINLRDEGYPDFNTANSWFWIGDDAVLTTTRRALDDNYSQFSHTHKYYTKNPGNQYRLELEYQALLKNSEVANTVEATIDQKGNLYTISNTHQWGDSDWDNRSWYLKKYSPGGQEILKKELNFNSYSYLNLRHDGQNGLIFARGDHSGVVIERLNDSDLAPLWEAEPFTDIVGGFGFSERPIQFLADDTFLFATSGWKDVGNKPEGTYIGKISLEDGSLKQILPIDKDQSYTSNELFRHKNKVIFRTYYGAYEIQADAYPSTPPYFYHDTTPPSVDSISTDGTGTSIIITLDEALADTAPANKLFSVKSGQKKLKVSESTVNAVEGTVILDLASPIQAGATISLSYKGSKKDAASGVIQDAAGNDLPKFANHSVTNNVEGSGDTTPPSIDSISTDGTGTSIIITLDEALADTAPANKLFSAKSGKKKLKVSESTVNAAEGTVILDLDSPIQAGATISLSYKGAKKDAASGVIQDAAGNDLPKFANHSVTNNVEGSGDTTPPSVDSISTDGTGTSIIITLDEALADTAPANKLFSVKSGKKKLKVSESTVSPAEGTVVLDLDSSIQAGATISLSYKGAKKDAASGVIQDAAGNDLPKFANHSVTNNVEGSDDRDAITGIRIGKDLTIISDEIYSHDSPEIVRLIGETEGTFSSGGGREWKFEFNKKAIIISSKTTGQMTLNGLETSTPAWSQRIVGIGKFEADKDGILKNALIKESSDWTWIPARSATTSSAERPTIDKILGFKNETSLTSQMIKSNPASIFYALATPPPIYQYDSDIQPSLANEYNTFDEFQSLEAAKYFEDGWWNNPINTNLI